MDLKNKKVYRRKCQYCDKIIESLSEPQVIYNIQAHEISCKNKLLKEVNK